MHGYTRTCPSDGYSYVTTETGWYCPHCGSMFWDIYGELKEERLYEKISREGKRQGRISTEDVPSDS